MRQVTFYSYDAQLRPGTIGADFQSDNSNEDYTLRYESGEAEKLGQDVIAWINEAVQRPS